MIFPPKFPALTGVVIEDTETRVRVFDPDFHNFEFSGRDPNTAYGPLRSISASAISFRRQQEALRQISASWLSTDSLLL
jgi:hypothetical protein